MTFVTALGDFRCDPSRLVALCYNTVTALTERFRQNAYPRGWGRSVQRYFFTIHGQERVEDDPNGTYLPDIAAVLFYAEYTIRELRKKIGYNGSGPDDDRNG
jgi:hypothetical protein